MICLFCLDPVPCLAAEDETGIKKLVMYDQKTDHLIGFCGKSGTPHQCTTDLDLRAGNSYSELKGIFDTHDIAGNCRVIILNPLHKSLPSAVVFLQATCNRFVTDDVRQQWHRLRELYVQTGLQDKLGPLIGTFPVRSPVEIYPC